MKTIQQISQCINQGDTIYYVTHEVRAYAIHKTRIDEKNVHCNNGFHTGIITSVYRFKDGYTFDTSRLFLPVFQARA